MENQRHIIDSTFVDEWAKGFTEAGEPSPEYKFNVDCPICYDPITVDRVARPRRVRPFVVLQCGHVLCVMCNQTNMNTALGNREAGVLRPLIVKCPLCMANASCAFPGCVKPLSTEPLGFKAGGNNKFWPRIQYIRGRAENDCGQHPNLLGLLPSPEPESFVDGNHATYPYLPVQQTTVRCRPGCLHRACLGISIRNHVPGNPAIPALQESAFQGWEDITETIIRELLN
ncbi:hypothetical protein F5Y15DRAFT_417762 [Xylariaceae sp. FL0016]|nr:hypothetical protein F5Y15DRAFT_417762 [Xylariaceae sp. FL0016]